MHRPTSNLAHGGQPSNRHAGGAQSKHPSGIGKPADTGQITSAGIDAKATEHARVPGGAPLKFKGKGRKKGFSLLEMLVVIGIIVLLASLVLAVSSSVVRASEERATRNTLEVLNAAVEEYERTLDRRVSYRSGAAVNGTGADLAASATARYDIDGGTAITPPSGTVTVWPTSTPWAATGGLPFYSTLSLKRTTNLIWAISQSPTAGAMLQKLPDSVFRQIRLNTTSTLMTPLRQAVDSWDTPIVAVFPGRDANANGYVDSIPANIDKDGTIKCDSEWALPTSGGLQVSCKNRRILFISAGNDARFTNLTAGVYAPSTDNLYSYDPQ